MSQTERAEGERYQCVGTGVAKEKPLPSVSVLRTENGMLFGCAALTLPCSLCLPSRSKECLVTSSGIDNTENGLSGSKADSKATPKKK